MKRVFTNAAHLHVNQKPADETTLHIRSSPPADPHRTQNTQVSSVVNQPARHTADTKETTRHLFKKYGGS